MTCQRLLRLPDVESLSGLKATSIYGMGKSGLFPPPIKLTTRSSAWPEHEIAAVNAARIAGHTDTEIKALVRRLVAARSTLPAQTAESTAAA
jgi:prophage regulatory protein